MPAKDFYHDLVSKLLQDDGWKITHDPYHMRIGKLDMFIDLGAENLLAAEKAGHKIAVEIKSFSGLSALNEFHAALGQFMNYRLALMDYAPERILYLAVPADVYEDFFTQLFPQRAVEYYKLRLLVYSIQRKEFVRWL